MTMEMTSSAPKMYLLAANHESDCRAEFKNGAELLVDGTSTGASLEDAAVVGAAIAGTVARFGRVLSASPAWGEVCTAAFSDVRTEEVWTETEKELLEIAASRAAAAV